MPAPSKSFTVIADTAVDPDSPLDTALMTALRDNDIHIEEWLGHDYTAAQNHNHDGVNSALVEIGPNAIRNGSFEDGLAGWVINNYTGGSHGINTANDMHGAQCLAITSTSAANGGAVALSGEYQSCTNGQDVSITLSYKASAVNVSSRARIIWYDKAKAQISTSDVYSSTNTPTAQQYLTTVLTAPSNARFWRVELVGGVPGAGSAAGTIYFDGIKGDSAPAAGDTCTYTGSLVEGAAMSFPGSTNTSNTYDLGSNRVVAGMRYFNDNSGNLLTYMRAYNIKNN